MISRIAVIRTACAASAALLLAWMPAWAQPTPAGADPKINERFLNPGLEWQERFEGESREIYSRRNDIVTTSGVKPGMTVADVGAGSGFMALLFAKQVGPSGRVIAADISKVFAMAIAVRARNEGLTNVSTVVSTQTETGLPADSVDIVITTDVYHHFEQVAAVLGSIHRALKDRKSTRLNSSHVSESRMPSSA